MATTRRADMFTADSRPSDDDLRENNARRVDAPAAPHAVSEVIAQAWRAWHAEVDFATRFVADAPDLDTSPDIITLKPETN